VDNDAGHAGVKRGRRRRETLRRHNPQGQGAEVYALQTQRLTFQIVYDLHQLPRESLPNLRDTIMRNLATFHAGPKPIRLQLCVCLANLAIQMTEWKDVLSLVVSALGTNPSTLPCVLDFLRVLPEEVIHGRKIALTVRSVEPPSTISLPAPSCGITV
jgi:transportin-3